jgi:hypothetical protein
MKSTTAGGADATLHSTLRHSGSARRGDLVNALYGSSDTDAEGVGNVETSGGGTQRRGSSQYFQQVNSKLRADCQSKSASEYDPEGGAVDCNDVHSGLPIVPALFRIDGLFQDAGIETEFRQQYAEDLAAKSLQFLAISRGMSIILFSSVASLGQTVGWDTPSGLTGNRIGGNLNFSDVFISSWLWISFLIISFATIFIPPAFLTLHKWWGPQLMCACQSFFFGLMTLVSMASLPSVLSLGIPLAYISQVRFLIRPQICKRLVVLPLLRCVEILQPESSKCRYDSCVDESLLHLRIVPIIPFLCMFTLTMPRGLGFTCRSLLLPWTLLWHLPRQFP